MGFVLVILIFLVFGRHAVDGYLPVLDNILSICTSYHIIHMLQTVTLEVTNKRYAYTDYKQMRTSSLLRVGSFSGSYSLSSQIIPDNGLEHIA